MQNKIWIALVVVLIVALVGIYMASTGPKKIGASLTELAKRLDTEIQRLDLRTAPFVTVGTAAGYVIDFENGAKFYISGDTGLTADLKLVIGDYYRPDVAIYNIGGLLNSGPEEAAYAMSLVNPKRYIIPYHYASFPILEQTPDRFFEELKKYNLAAQPLDPKIGVEKEVMGVKILWLGHGTYFFVSPEGKRILIDPAVKFTGVVPEEYQDFTKLEGVDFVLLTHAHPDHVVISDLEALVRLYNPIIFAQYEVGIWLKEKMKVEGTIYDFLNKGGTIGKENLAAVGMPAEKIGDIRFHMVPAEHSASGYVQ